MYKIIHYGTAGKVLIIDGKFRCALIIKDNAFGVFNSTDVYYMHEGTMRKTSIDHIPYRVIQGLEEEALFREGKIQHILDSKNCLHYRTTRKDFITSFREMRKDKRTVVEVGTIDVALVHFRDTNTIYTNDAVQYLHANSDTRIRTMLTYMHSKFTYHSSGSGIKFEGYPDMDDSAQAMNFMLAMGNVQDLRKCQALFEEYTKHMDIKY